MNMDPNAPTALPMGGPNPTGLGPRPPMGNQGPRINPNIGGPRPPMGGPNPNMGNPNPNMGNPNPNAPPTNTPPTMNAPPPGIIPESVRA